MDGWYIVYRQVLQVPKILCVEPCMDALSSGSDVTRSLVPQGDWANGAKNGKGMYLCKNGVCYDGRWKDDMRHGYHIPPSILKPQPSILNPKQQTLNTRPSTINPKQQKLNPTP